MSEYTTSELFEAKVGKRFKMIQPTQEIVIEMTERGLIVLKDGISTKHTGEHLPLSKVVLDAVWRDVGVDVTLDEALEVITINEHLKNKKSVFCELHGVAYEYISIYDSISLEELINGRWYVIDE